MINFESMLFDEVVQRVLLYSPKIEIKPAHLANGLFRSICGTSVNATSQHAAVYPKGYPTLPDILPYSYLNANKQVREMLNSLLAADSTVFQNVQQSSYSLSHVSHITNDNHDRRAGEWLHAILARDTDGGTSPALGLLRELLTQTDRERSDELSVLTLPLVDPATITLDKFPHVSATELPKSLAVDGYGRFCDPVVQAIRGGFDQLAEYDRTTARYNGKLDTLRHLVTWGCFAIYLHLANIGRSELEQRVPMLLVMTETSSPTLQQASIQSYQWVSRLIDKFFRQEFLKIIDDWSVMNQYGALETDADLQQQIRDIKWKRQRGGMKQSVDKLEKYSKTCLTFYLSYCSDTANQSPRVAFTNAVTDMMDAVLSSSPRVVARGLGVRIGLLTTSRKQTQKLYAPQSDLLEVLVRASVPRGAQWTIQELAHHWVDHFGILFGALGNENERLATWGISGVDGATLNANVDALAKMLEMSGYARRYADGVVLVEVKE